MARRRKQARPPATKDLPAALYERLALLLGDELPELERALQGTPPTSIRVNPAKPGAPQGTPVPWCATGRYLAERPQFTLDPFLHAGAYYVQEASSMLIEQALLHSGLLQDPILALDLCAAPGGKTTLLRSLLHPDALLVANEVDGRRRSVLQENLWKWGHPNVVVSGSDPVAFSELPERFDLVLVDAPCSGEGLFRKEPYARTQWSTALVEQCAVLQQRIVEQAWTALRPGGVLIYSTCTWESAENEERLAQLAAWGAQPIPMALPAAWGTVPVGVAGLEGHRCYPHRVQGEGYFMATMRKPGAFRAASSSIPTARGDGDVRTLLLEPERWWLTEHDGVLHAVDTSWGDVVQDLQRTLHVVSPGRPVAERRAGHWRPHAALALDIGLRRGAFPEVELDRAAALRYLRGEALPAEAANGTALAVHGGLPLGWLQGAGRRWNNGWPAPWRIRMQGA